MKQRLITVLVAVGLFATTAVAAGAITWGQPDGDAHPQVVQLLFVQNGDGYYGCSGTMLSPYVVLTAGHCTGWVDDDGNLQPNDGATYVRNDFDIFEAFFSERPSYDSTAEWLDATWVSGQAMPHPDYDDFGSFPLTYDIGLVLLDDPIYVDAYGELPDLGQFDYLAKKKLAPENRMVQVVGYGRVGAIPPFVDDSIWQRYVGYSTITNAGQSANVGPHNFQYTNNPGKGSGVGGTCSGDSGGPAFWIDPASGEATNLIVGVNSYGIAPLCNGTDYQFRTDTAAALDFVTPYVDWTP